MPLQSFLQCCLQPVNSLHHVTNCENSQCKCIPVSLTVNTWTANFVNGIIKSLVQQQVFLKSVVSIHLNKHGIYAQLRWKHSFPWQYDCVTDFTHPRPLGVQSSKYCFVTKFYCCLTSEKYWIVFYFIMMGSIFSATLCPRCYKGHRKFLQNFFFLTLVVKMMGAA